MIDQENDLQSMERIAEGQSKALEALYDRHAPLVFSVVRRILQHDEDAEEALQETWLEVWKRHHGYDPKRGSVAAWLITLASRRALDLHRRRAPQLAATESHDAYLELCAAKALDALDGEGRAKLEAHLAQGCPECEAALVAYDAAKIAVAAPSPGVTPRAQAREKLLASVARERQEIDAQRLPEIPRPPPAPHRAPWGLVWGLTAFGLLFLALNFWNWQRGNTLLQERDAARAEAVRLTAEQEDARTLVAVVQAPETKMAVLLPTPESNQSQRGSGYFDPATGDAVLIFRHMDKLDARDFELWALYDAKRTSLGLLHVDPNGGAVVSLKGVTDPAHLSAFAVSLEPAGGSRGQGLTGPVVLVGSIGSTAP